MKLCSLEIVEQHLCNEMLLEEWKEHNKYDKIRQLDVSDVNNVTYKDNEKCFYIKNEDGKIVGFLSYIDGEDDVYIRRIFIKPEFRKKGYCSDALRQMIDKCKSENKTLSGDVYGDNPAMNVYEKLGCIKQYIHIVFNAT